MQKSLEGCRPAPYFRISHEFHNDAKCFSEQSTAFNLWFLFCLLPPPSLSLYMFSIYLKQKYMDCIKHGKANRCYSWQKHKKNHKLLFYSSIFVYSRDLFSLYIFFFFERNKKSFSFLSECFCDLLTQTVRKSINSPFKVSECQTAQLLIFNCATPRAWECVFLIVQLFFSF